MLHSIVYLVRRSRIMVGSLVLSLLVLSLAAQENPNSVQNSSSQYSPSKQLSRSEFDESNKLRIREGTTIIDRGGYFRLDGEGAIFVTEDQHEFGALQNLNLERIVRTLKSSDEAESIRWSVNGVVTEFNGRNHLLINRAVYKSSVPPPTPEQIVN